MRMKIAPLGDKLLPSAGKLDTPALTHPAKVTTTLTPRAALRQNHLTRTRLTPTRST